MKRKRDETPRPETIAAGVRLPVLLDEPDPTRDEVARAVASRPRNRSECVGGPRPCPFVGCRYNLYLDVKATRKGGSVRLNWPGLEPHEIPPHASCALDVADRGAHSLDEVGKITNLTRERVRQLGELIAHRVKRALKEWDE